MSSWRRAHCPPCMTATGCRDHGLSAQSWSIWADVTAMINCRRRTVDSEIDPGNEGHVRRTDLADAAGEDESAATGAERAASGHHHRGVAAGHASGRDRALGRAEDQPRHAARGHAAAATGRPDL